MKRERWTIEKAKGFYKQKNLILLEEEYINNSTPMKCLNCEGYLVQICLSNLQCGQTPFPFVKSNPYVITNIQKMLRDKYKSKTEILSKEYINNSTNLKFRCECGNIFERTLGNLKESVVCYDCGHSDNIQRQRLDFNYVKEQYFKQGYVLLDNDYKSNSTKMLCETINEGYKIKVAYCNIKKRNLIFSFNFNKEFFDYNIERFLQNNNEIKCKYLGIFDEEQRRILLQCECGNTFNSPYWHLLNKSRTCCEICSSKMSSYENKTQQWLEKNNIDFCYQKKFSDCKDKKILPFDFYIPKLNMCIEVDGEQHFKELESKYYSPTTTKHDKVKDEYCKENNIKLLRIPYYCFKDETYIQILNDNIL